MTPTPRVSKKIAVAQHLWDAYEQMAEAMGADRESLINQALHAFARSQGFLERGEAEGAPAIGPAAKPAVAPAPAGSRPPPGVLRYQLSSGRTGELEGERMVIGRGRHCQLTLDVSKVSREHAAIHRSPGGFVLEDLGSANGTWFDGARIRARTLEHGDVVYFCGEPVTFLVGGEGEGGDA